MNVINPKDIDVLTRIHNHCIRIEDAQNRFGNTLEAFSNDADYQDVVNMNILQIGELSNDVSDETKAMLEDIPWRKIYGIRNIMAHAYIIVESKTIWETVVNDIPELKSRLEEII